MSSAKKAVEDTKEKQKIDDQDVPWISNTKQYWLTYDQLDALMLKNNIVELVPEIEQIDDPQKVTREYFWQLDTKKMILDSAEYCIDEKRRWSPFYKDDDGYAVTGSGGDHVVTWKDWQKVYPRFE